MADRKPISKKVRFEVFKRDDFTCQYCGKKPPEAVLHVDHIVPVAEGGSNDVLNLVTACSDCNLGKGKRLLDGEFAEQVTHDRMEEMERRKEQLEMMYEWNRDIIDIENEEIEAVNVLIKRLTGYGMGESAVATMRRHLSKFGLKNVLESTRIAFTKYRHDTDTEWATAFSKIGGICYNRANPRCGLCKEKVDEDGDTVECKTYGEMPSDSARICPIYSPWFGGGFR